MTTRIRAVALATALLMTAGACGSGDAGQRQDTKLTVWTLENLPDRLAAQKSLAERFSLRGRRRRPA
jgi:multiple sugar transport system substrate-binding protein